MKTNTADGKNLLDLKLVNDNEQIIIYIHLGRYDSISVADPGFDLRGGAVDFVNGGRGGVENVENH